jgi:hypothetical protein
MAMRVISNTEDPFLSPTLYRKPRHLATVKAYFAVKEKYFLGKEVREMEKAKRIPVIPPEIPWVPDPMGSYTGLPKDPFDRPVQDADDL